MKHQRTTFLISVATILLAASSSAAPAITDVSAQQRYPWNGKVDISYTVSGDIAATASAQGGIPFLKVTATDDTTGTTYVATSLDGDTALTDGTHSIVWDMEAQGLTFVSSNVVFSVSCETTPITYSVKFNANGGSGTMADQDFTYDTAMSLTENAFTRMGYTFDGWATSASGAKVYDNTQSVSNLTTVANATVNLYALWTANAYAVKFNKNATDATGSMSNELFTYDTAKALTANTFTRTGYTFREWGSGADGGATHWSDKQVVSNLTATAGDVVNLYAIWKANTYTVKFSANGGSGTMSNESFTYGTEKTLTSNAFTCNGYVFNGWATRANGAKVYDDGQSVSNLTSTAGATVNLYALWTPAPYCVIDLSAGANASSYPVTYLAAPPSGGFNVDAYKTTKLVLKRIESGSFMMGESVNVTLTKPFFIGLFEVTQKQFQLVTGSNPSNFSGDKRPVEYMSYNIIRGSTNGAKWPESNAVDSSSFLGKLRTRTGLDFDLPTEAQWEYACRAGTTTTYSYGDSANGNYMWYDSNASSQTHDVGTKQPNPWGLYDMHGNVWEWCLDWSGTLSGGTDPKGNSSGTIRILRGGSWENRDSWCSSSYRYAGYPSAKTDRYGFRLARTLNQ